MGIVYNKLLDRRIGLYQNTTSEQRKFYITNFRASLTPYKGVEIKCIRNFQVPLTLQTIYIAYIFMRNSFKRFEYA